MIPMSLDLTALFAPILAIGVSLFLAAAAGVAASALHDLTNHPTARGLSHPEPQPA